MNLTTERCEQLIAHFKLEHIGGEDREKLIVAIKYAFKLGSIKDVMATKYREGKK